MAMLQNNRTWLWRLQSRGAVALVLLAMLASTPFARAQDEKEPGEDERPPVEAPADTGESPKAVGTPQLPDTLTPPDQSRNSALISSVGRMDVPLVLDLGLSTLIRTKLPVSRISITSPNVLEVIQHGPREIELIGRAFGVTSMIVWFNEGDDRPMIRYHVQVGPRPGRRYRQELREKYWEEMELRINALFPNSSIQLVPVMEKLLVRGQARDPMEAQRIMSFMSTGLPTVGQVAGQGGGGQPGFLGQSIDPSEGDAPIGTSTIIDMLEIPGEQNIMLKCRIATVNRSALRQFGMSVNPINRGRFSYNQSFGLQPNISAVFDAGRIPLLIEAFENNGYVKILAEPNLVTISGASASFIAGGAFPVPTVVGLGGVGAAGTSFRSIGTQVFFTPTVIDKDRIRMIVSASFSTVNGSLGVAGVPGTDNRAVQTIVDMREGQWLAVAGLIQDQMSGGKSRIPLVGNLPIVEWFFSAKNISRDEQEVLILVSPELVHAMDAEDSPLMLPGAEITEPDDWTFYIQGRYEGRLGVYHRSTVWQEYKHRIRDALKAARVDQRYQNTTDCYMAGDHGFSR